MNLMVSSAIDNLVFDSIDLSVLKFDFLSLLFTFRIVHYSVCLILLFFWGLYFFKHREVRLFYRWILRAIKGFNHVVFIIWTSIFVLDFFYSVWRARFRVPDTMPEFSLVLIIFVYLSVYILNTQWVEAYVARYQLNKPEKIREYEEKVLKKQTEAPNPVLAKYKKKLESGSIHIGSYLNGNKFYNLNFDPDDFRRHVFIVGKTGMGKTTLIKNIVRQFCKRYEEIPVLIVEFKGEYFDLQDDIPDFQIIKPGENFSINIFNPYESEPSIHALRVFQIIKSCDLLNVQAEFSPQMEKMLIEVLELTCGTEEDRSWEGFFRNLELYTRRYRNIIPMLEQTMVSIENRLHSFTKEPMCHIFNETSTLPLDSVFGCNTIIDLSSIIKLGGTKREILFFLNMIFKRLYDLNISRGKYENFKHLTILEESQYFIPQRRELQTKLTEYIEDIAMVQRGLGEVLITAATTPFVSENVVNNAGIVFAFQTSFDDLFCENILGVNRNDRKILTKLSIGKCLVKISELTVPFICKVSDPKVLEKKVKKKNKVIKKEPQFTFESNGVYSIE
jgi:hypothetical protein